MGYVTPTLDEMLVIAGFNALQLSSLIGIFSFMQSIEWVDTTYIQKHKSENPDTLRAMYYPSLVMYPTKGSARSPRPKSEAIMMFFHRYAKRMGMLLGLYLLSLTPVIGRFVMPATSFYTFRSHVGTAPAAVIFGAGLILPKAFIVKFLHTYFASRSLMRELVSLSFTLDSDWLKSHAILSLSRTSAVLNLRLNKSAAGFVTGKVSCSDLLLLLRSY
jgi:hypothetical protein